MDNPKIQSVLAKCRNGSLNYKLLYKETSFLEDKISTSERLWYITNNIFNQVKCPECGKPSTIDYKKNIQNFCSRTCNIIHLDDNGDSIAKRTARKISIKRKLLDKNGVSCYQKSAIKQSNTKTKLDENGDSIAKLSAKKSALTMSKLDENGDSIYSKSAIKQSNTKTKLDENGDSIAKLSAKKSVITVTRLEENGDSIAKRTSKKGFITKSILDENGDSIAKRASRKAAITFSNIMHTKTYYNRLNNFPNEYILLTTKEEYINSNNKILKYSCNKCSSIRQSFWPYIRCLECYPYNKSIGENEVLEFCQSLTSNIQSNSRRIISPLELDMYLPDHNLAIEYNGIYWHSSDSVETENKDYHLHKTQQCASKNIQLFHIFENEWLDPQKQLIWKSIISNRLGKSQRIFARKTEVRSVTSGDTREFLNINHLQGSCVSLVNLGLYFEGRLVSIMTFGRSRYDKSMDWEMIRFCNEIGISVVGGASKLLKNFTLNNKGSIVSYADKRRSNGGLYERLGFSLSHESGPNYFYWKDQGLESRIKYQKYKLSKLLEEYDDDLTETQNMYNNGYRKIFDCGNQVWIL